MKEVRRRAGWGGGGGSKVLKDLGENKGKRHFARETFVGERGRASAQKGLGVHGTRT